MKKKIIEITRKKCAKYLPEKIKKHLRPIYYNFLINRTNQNFYNSTNVNSFDEIISLDDIKKIINRDDIKVVSFDIFDTLLVRPVVDPSDIFYLIASKVDKKFKINFFKIRSNVEKEIKKDNLNIFDIYEYIRQKYDLSKDIIDSLIEEEINTEKKLLNVRTDMFNLYQEAILCGKKIICVSDMYLPSFILIQILKEKGFSDIEKVFVSNEYKARKDDGALFSLVLNDLKIKNKNLLHIGDNYVSDYKKPLNLGILSIYYPSNKELFLCSNSPFSKVFNGFLTKDPYSKILLGFIINKIFSDRNFYKNKGEALGTIDVFSVMSLFPVILYTCLSVFQNKEIQGRYKKIYFASRDGYLPQKVYDIINENLNFSGLPSEYLYVGRRAYYMAIEKDFFNYLKNKPVDGSKKYTIENIIDCYILDKDLNLKIKNTLNKKIYINFLDNKEKCISLLSPFKDEIYSHILMLKNNAIKYYAEKFSEIKRGIVFDLGYSGSVSNALFKMTNKLFDKIYLWETEKNKKLDRLNKTKTFVLFEKRHPTEHIILEEMFSPLSGGCIGFTKSNEGKISPVFEDLQFSEQMIKDMNTAHSLILDLTKDFCILFADFVKDFEIKDKEFFQKVGWYAFSDSQHGEELMFKNIIFPDSIFMPETESLSEKILKNRKYKDVFDGTGYNLNSNYIDSLPVPEKINTNLKLAIHLHLYNLNLYNEILSYLKDFPFEFDLIVTTDNDDKRCIAEKIFNNNFIKNLKNTYIIITPNRGRDVAPWLIHTRDFQEKYDLWCHIHSKESPHFDFSKRWRNYLFKNLISKEAVLDIVCLFEHDKKLGIVQSEPFPPLKSFIFDFNIPLVGETVESSIIDSLLIKMRMGHLSRLDLKYSLGTMFWYRGSALKPLFDLGLRIEDFPEEPIGVGGTIAHAIERLPPIVSERYGYKSRFYTKYKE